MYSIYDSPLYLEKKHDDVFLIDKLLTLDWILPIRKAYQTSTFVVTDDPNDYATGEERHWNIMQQQRFLDPHLDNIDPSFYSRHQSPSLS